MPNRIRILISLSVMLLVLLALVASSSDPQFSRDVIFDGVTYSPSEFDDIQRNMNSNDEYLIFTSGPTGEILAFSSEGTYNEYRVANGLRPESLYPPEAARKQKYRIEKIDSGVLVTTDGSAQANSVSSELQSGGGGVQMLSSCPSPYSSTSVSWEHSDCGGEWVGFGIGVAWADLGDVGGFDWNDTLSSSVAATSVQTLILYQHSNFGGNLLQIPAGQTRSNLGSYGFNDIASSLWTKP